jgi:hypothetical protein
MVDIHFLSFYKMGSFGVNPGVGSFFDGSFSNKGPLVTGAFCDGTFSDRSFSNGTFIDGFFSDGSVHVVCTCISV